MYAMQGDRFRAAKPSPCYQYPINRPAVIAAIQQVSEAAPIHPSRRVSIGVRSRVPIARHAPERRMPTAFTTPSAIAGNLIVMNGLPWYSVAFEESRPTPVAAASANPAAAKGAAARVNGGSNAADGCRAQ